MNRVYLLIAGVLTGAAVGLLTGQVPIWLCLGAAMGAVLTFAARPRPNIQPNRNGQQPMANGQRRG